MDSCPKNIPHFFKIILDDTIRDGKLGIPRKFVRRYENNLLSPVVLKVPSGAKWQIELVKHDDEIWLQNGWQEFQKHYSLSHGSFLVFKYNQRTREFNVIIFDKSASEIDYPFDIINGDKDEADLVSGLKEKKIEAICNPSIGECKKSKNEESTSNMKVSQIRHSGSKVSGALETADRFTSANPFFKVKIRSSYLKHNTVNVPKRFVANFTNKRTKNVMLQVGSKQWLVKLIIFNHSSYDHYRLSAGFSLFAKENSLRVGDVCIFELINNETVLLKVSIFRNVK